MNPREKKQKSSKLYVVIASYATFFSAMFRFSDDVIKFLDRIGFDLKICSYIFFVLFLIIHGYLYTKITINDFSVFGKEFKKWFVIPIGVLFLLFTCFSIYFTTKNIDSGLENKSYKRRIVLLFPLNEDLSSAYQDGVRQLLGFTEFLKNNPEYSKNIEFRIYDHSMNVDVAERIIREEMDEGTLFFFSTMSKVNVPLSKRFSEMVRSYNFKGQKPVLVCGVTSAPTVKLVRNMVFRYYIRSQEEAKKLAEIGMAKNLKTATFIAVNDDYGRNAVDEFKRNWNGKVTEGVYLEPSLTESEIRQLIADKILIIQSMDRDAIFICHYGNGVDNSISSLYSLNISASILATSTLSIKEWQKPIEKILKEIEWYTCVPEYSTCLSNQNDVIKNFTTYAIEKLVKSALDSSFVDTWSRPMSPNNLNVEYVNGDLVVPMKVVYKNYFK